MLIVINDSPKKRTDKVRGVVGRYCWKIARDVWIWPRRTPMEQIIQELSQYSFEVRVQFFWKDSKSELGFDHRTFGVMGSRQTSNGLFNLEAEF